MSTRAIMDMLMNKFRLEGLTQREYEILDKLFKKNKEQFPTCADLTDLINLGRMENNSKWEVWEDLGDNKTMLLFKVDTLKEAKEATRRLWKNGVKAFWDFPEDRKMKEESLMSKEELEQFRIHVMAPGV